MANERLIVVAAIQLPQGIVNTQGAEVQDAWNAILNVGEEDGIREGQDFIIYTLGDEIFDPVSGKSLGYYELVRGRGEVIHTQQKLCTVRSLQTKQVVLAPTNAFSVAVATGRTQMKTVEIPFSILRVGDLARRV
jgi:hypothetical protein